MLHNHSSHWTVERANSVDTYLPDWYTMDTRYVAYVSMYDETTLQVRSEESKAGRTIDVGRYTLKMLPRNTQRTPRGHYKVHGERRVKNSLSLSHSRSFLSHVCICLACYIAMPSQELSTWSRSVSISSAFVSLATALARGWIRMPVRNIWVIGYDRQSRLRV